MKTASTAVCLEELLHQDAPQAGLAAIASALNAQLEGTGVLVELIQLSGAPDGLIVQINVRAAEPLLAYHGT